MTWEMDLADRWEEQYGRPLQEDPYLCATTKLRKLLQTLPPKARHASEFRAAFKHARDLGLDAVSQPLNLYDDAMARMRELEELEDFGSPTCIKQLVDVCLSLPSDAEPSLAEWCRAPRPPRTLPRTLPRTSPRTSPRTFSGNVYRRGINNASSSAQLFAASLEETPYSLEGTMSGVGMTHSLRALSRFRAASLADIKELIRLVRSATNPYVAGVGLTTLAVNVAFPSNVLHSTGTDTDESQRQSTLGDILSELAPTLLQVVEAFPGKVYGEWGDRGAPEWQDLQTVSKYVPAGAREGLGTWSSMDVTWLRLRLERNARVAREAQRAATIILCRIEPHLVASFAPEDAARPSVVAALLARDSAKLRRHTWATLRGVPPDLLAALTPTLLGHAASCEEEADLSEIANLIASAPDALLATTPQVLPPTRVLLTQKPQVSAGLSAGHTSSELLRSRRALALGVLVRLAGPHLDTLLYDAQVTGEGAGDEGEGEGGEGEGEGKGEGEVRGAQGNRQGEEASRASESDEAKDIRLNGLLEDVAVALRGYEDADPLCELASRFVASVEAPGGASAKRHAKSAARDCGGLIT